jgi:dUTP pyrophosphatase
MSETLQPMSETLHLPIRRMSEDVEIPSYAYEGDAGLDLRASQDCTLKPFQRAFVHTGLQVAIPSGHAGFVLPRSGMASRRGITLVNSPGLIDSQYRGEIMLAVLNVNAGETVTIEKGERVAQLVILAIPTVVACEVDVLDQTERGAQGFGSSGTR